MSPRLAARLDALRDALAAPAPDGDDALAGWRVRIDAIDRTVLALLNERARAATAIGEIKRARGLPVYAPRREEDVLANVCAANGGPLAPEAVRRVFERVIDETRSLERELTESHTPEAVSKAAAQPPEAGATAPEAARGPASRT